jgi:RecA-family ATPase
MSQLSIRSPSLQASTLFENSADVYPVLGIADLLHRPPPVFLIGRHIPELSLGFLYGEPGCGKSFLALDFGLHVAFGLQSWNGDPIHADDDTLILYLAAEGSFGLGNRVAAWMKHHGFTAESERFQVIEVPIDFMKEADIAKLIRTIRSSIRKRPCLIVVDTVSRAMPGADENLQKDMTLFIRAAIG